MSETERLDRTDLLILDALQQNARITNKELAAQIHLSPSPTFERWKRLEREGYIKKYIAVLDAGKLNRGFVVFCCVKLSRLNTETANDFTERIGRIPEVTECYNISGHFDYMLKIHSFEAISAVSYQCTWQNRECRFDRKYFCDGRDEAQLWRGRGLNNDIDTIP